MNTTARALLTLLAALAIGGLLWVAAQFDTTTTGGYWAAMAVIAAGGLLFGLAQVRNDEETSPALRFLAFLPAIVAALWVIVAAQPDPNTYRNHVGAWSSDL